MEYLEVNLIDPIPQAGTAFQLGSQLRARLEPLGERLHCPNESVVFSQGATCNGVYLLSSGTARILIRDERGGTITCREVGAGSILGLPASLCLEPYMFTAETTSDCSFAFITAERFQEFLRAHPEMCMEVVRLMSQELATLKRKRIEPSKCLHSDCSLRGSCSCN